MNRIDIKNRIEIEAELTVIEALAKHGQRHEASIREDRLVDRFVEIVAENETLTASELKELAKEIVKVFEIKFERWNY